jgi:16S rRNA (guanine527-N7)-methyltransferase
MNPEIFDQRVPFFLQLGVPEAAVSKLRSYVELLWESNEELNLISRKMTFEELLDNHLVDCLLPLALFPAGVRVAADFGSGGGLPGVVYAIIFPQIRYLLFEKSPKKREFLHRCRALATNLEIHGEIPSDPVGVEIVTARAFKPMDVILDISRSYFSRKGRYFLLKGRREKIDEEIVEARRKFKELQVEIVQLKSPILEVERHLVLI